MKEALGWVVERVEQGWAEAMGAWGGVVAMVVQGLGAVRAVEGWVEALVG